MTTPPPGPPPPGLPSGYYPQQPYYAPGWTAPVPSGPPPRRSHRGLLIAAICAVALLLAGVLTGGVLGVRYLLDTRPLGRVDGPVTAAVRRLDVGHCIADLPDDGQVSRVGVVPCGQAHEAEVVGASALRQDTWPGQDAVDEQVAASCEMDSAQRDAGFRAVGWSPTQAGWAQGDRRGLCLAWYDGGGVRGSWTSGDDVRTG